MKADPNDQWFEQDRATRLRAAVGDMKDFVRGLSSLTITTEELDVVMKDLRQIRAILQETPRPR